jgi:hypothetical protein
LPIQQYVTTDHSHELIVRPAASDFYCRLTPPQRLAAITAFYRQADAAFKARGIDDLPLVVDINRSTLNVRPVARADHRHIELTRRGRRRRNCS